MRRLSIVVCTYNRCESLKDTLRALKVQKLEAGLELEILAIDNNSSDETRKIIEQNAENSFWPVKYFFEALQGLSFARNRGIREASGEMIAFTDDDVIPAESWAQSLWNGMNQFNAEALGGKILPLWAEEPPAWCEVKALWGPLSLLDRGDAVIVPEKLDRNLFYGANMAFRKNVFNEIGFFRTDLGMGAKQISRGEDTEILERLYKAGKRIVYYPDAVVRHKVSSERMKVSYVRRLAFDAGRALAFVSGDKEKLLSKWHLRQCLESAGKMIRFKSLGDNKKAFELELEFWMGLGKIYQGIKL